MLARKIHYLSPFDSDLPFQEEDVSPHAHPFWLKASNEKSDTVVICLHGYTASSYETLPVAKEIIKYGIDAIGPTLPGHGFKKLEKQIEGMKTAKKEDWLTAVRQEINLAKKEYKNVFIYGQSMGGAISLIMSAEGLVDACAVTAPAIKLQTGTVISLIFFHWTGLVVHESEEDQPDFFNDSYPFKEAYSGYELVKISKIARKSISNIRCPLLVCHSKKDQTITPKIVYFIEKKIPNKDSLEIAWFDKGGHTMPLDLDGPEVVKRIARFFKEQREKILN